VTSVDIMVMTILFIRVCYHTYTFIQNNKKFTKILHLKISHISEKVVDENVT